MEFPKAWRWTAAGGIFALVVVSIGIAEPGLRALLSVLSIAPLLYITARFAFASQRRLAQARRKYTKLRNTTDEFIMSVRNLNRLTVLSQDTDAPENAPQMIEEIVQRMYKLVDRIVEAAGKADPRAEVTEESQ